MNAPFICPDQQRPCPTPDKCQTDCHFNTATLPTLPSEPSQGNGRFIIRLLLVALILCLPWAAHAQTLIGLHTATYHDPGHGANDINPGVYIITDKGWTAGTYYNSHFRQTFYAGYTTPEWHRIKITAGGVTGYYDGINLSVAPSVRIWTFDNGVNMRLVGGPKMDAAGQSILHILLDWELK